MSEVKVSICVPTYNNPEDVSRLLQSIARQTYKDYEVCISDDSTDDKIEKI
nr:glycosyltransferase [Butyrivibrio sp.]